MKVRRLCSALIVALSLVPAGSGSAMARAGHVSAATVQQFPAFRLYRMVYNSTGLAGEPINVTGIIAAPNGPAPAGGRDIVAWAHPTTGVVFKCAPTRLPDELAHIPGLEAMLARGYIVTATDYPGLGSPGPHPYLVGPSEARAVLDSVRAVHDLLGAEAGRRFVVWGHSQGGHAALFTGQLARSYAPELRLVGVAAAAPATELGNLFSDDLKTVPGKVLTAMTLYSWGQVYGAPLTKVAGPSQLAEVDRIANTCLPGIENELDLYLLTAPLQGDFLKVKNLTQVSPWRGLLARNTPTGAGIDVPIFIAQGTADTIVDPPVTFNFAKKLCRRGKTLDLYVMPGVNHGKAGFDSAAVAIDWMAARFAGQPAPSTCGG